jgi:tight adherence protein B
MPGFTMIIMAAGLLAAIGIAFYAFAGPSPAKAQVRRLEGLRERHSKSSDVAAQAQLRRIISSRNTKMDGALQKLIPNPALLRLRLERTGKSWTLSHYVMGSVGLAVLVGAMMMVRGMPFLLALFFGLFAGIGLPYFITGKMVKRRVMKFTSKFPDAIELMVRGLRSGLPISETMGIVASEVPGPVSVEFRLVSDKMKIGRTMEAALQETSDRLGTPEFQFFVITLAIQRETGGNLAETLANLADVLRKRAAMKLKIRAMSSEAKASAIILGALPFVVFGIIAMLNPDYMGGFFTEPRLIVAGLGGMVWMSIGVFIMAKMVNFEI